MANRLKKSEQRLKRYAITCLFRISFNELIKGRASTLAALSTWVVVVTIVRHWMQLFVRKKVKIGFSTVVQCAGNFDLQVFSRHKQSTFQKNRGEREMYADIINQTSARAGMTTEELFEFYESRDPGYASELRALYQAEGQEETPEQNHCVYVLVG